MFRRRTPRPACWSWLTHDDQTQRGSRTRCGGSRIVINRIGNEQIEQAARVVFAEASRDGRQMAFAVVDEAGGLLYGIRMARCHVRVLEGAIRKAYTAAVMQRDTIVFRDQDQERGKSLGDWGDVKLTHLVGGVLIERQGESFGGVAVGGHETHRDDELARRALEVLVAQ